MLIDSIKKNFRFLFEDYGFVVSNIPDENTDWSVVLILGVLRIRFVEDRANMFMDIAFTNAPNHWYEIVSVLSLVNKARGVSRDIRVKNNVGSLRSVLKGNLGELIGLANTEEFRCAVSGLKRL